MASSRKTWFRSDKDSRASRRGRSSGVASGNAVRTAQLLRGRTQRVQRQPLRAANIVDLRKMTASDGTQSRKARRAQDRESKMRQKRRARQAKSNHKGFRYQSSLSSKIVSRKALRHHKAERVTRANAKSQPTPKKPSRQKVVAVDKKDRNITHFLRRGKQKDSSGKTGSKQRRATAAANSAKISADGIKQKSAAFAKASWALIQKPLLIVGSVGSAMALIVIVGFSSMFRVDRVVLSGDTDLHQSELNEALEDQLVQPRWWQAPSRSVLGWSQTEVAQAVSDVHPELASLTLERKLPNVIVVHVEDRVPAAIWRTSNGLFIVDDQGYACCEATLSDWADADVPRVTDRSAREVSVNTQATKQRHIEALHAIEDGIATEVPVIEIDRYEFPAAQAEEVHVITQEGVKLFFSLGLPIEDQLNKLRITLSQEVGDQFISLEYIDLRVSEYAYYR